MSKIITQQDIVDSIVGLKNVARDLRQAVDGPTVAGVNPPAVPVAVPGLLAHAGYLDQVAEELQNLIPATKVTVPKKRAGGAS